MQKEVQYTTALEHCNAMLFQQNNHHMHPTTLILDEISRITAQLQIAKRNIDNLSPQLLDLKSQLTISSTSPKSQYALSNDSKKKQIEANYLFVSKAYIQNYKLYLMYYQQIKELKAYLTPKQFELQQTSISQCIHCDNCNQLKQINNELIEENKKLKKKNSYFVDKNKEIMSQHCILQNKYNKLQKMHRDRIDKFKKNNNQLIQENNKLKDEYNQLQAKINHLTEIINGRNSDCNDCNDCNEYTLWNSIDVAKWIVNINKTRFCKYYDNLLDADIDGNNLDKLTINYLNHVGIKENNDKIFIYDKIQELISSNQDDDYCYDDVKC